MPTFADLAGVAPPAQSDGVSLVPTLTGRGTQRSRGFLYFEYDYSGRPFPVDKELGQRKHFKKRDQMQSIRIGDFAAVRYAITNSAHPFRFTMSSPIPMRTAIWRTNPPAPPPWPGRAT